LLPNILYLILLGAVLFFFFNSNQLIRGIAKEQQVTFTLPEKVRQTILDTKGFIYKVSSSSQAFAEGSSQQAGSLEETSSYMEEIASMTKQNSEIASHADTLMKGVWQVIGEANRSMKELTESMTEISKASEETQKIVKTIDEISFQTNLLALNAAVEAARAGEAGAGFAVVADEVRNLALRAADAAKQTAELIEKTSQKITDGYHLVSKTNDAFGRVQESASKVGELIGETAAASKEQTEGIHQVSTAVNEMDKVVQQNAASAEENASASEMNAQAEQMKAYVEALVRMVEGTGEGTKTTIFLPGKRSATKKEIRPLHNDPIGKWRISLRGKHSSG